MKGKKPNGRKFTLYLITFFVLLCLFIVTLFVRGEAITEISLSAFIGIEAALYLIYVNGNVKSKIAVGQYFHAEFGGEEKKDVTGPPC